MMRGGEKSKRVRNKCRKRRAERKVKRKKMKMEGTERSKEQTTQIR